MENSLFLCYFDYLVVLALQNKAVVGNHRDQFQASEVQIYKRVNLTN